VSATSEILLQTLLSGVLIGFIYALVAVGLTMIFGVMDIVNFAHGEFLMLGMYASFWGFSLWMLDPVFTLPLTALMLFALGASIYHLIIRRIIHAPVKLFRQPAHDQTSQNAAESRDKELSARVCQ